MEIHTEKNWGGSSIGKTPAPTFYSFPLVRPRAPDVLDGFYDPKNPFRLNWKCSLTSDAWNVAAIRLLAYRLHVLFAERKDKKK